MIVSFTGPSSLTALQEAECRRVLRQLRTRYGGIDIWRSGGAFGLDTLVVEESGVHQDVKLYVPAGLRWNSELLRFDFQETIYVPGGYRKRNEALVRGSDELHAFVKSLTFYRSGEWMTINIARKMGIPTTLHEV
jgi:hypothetical protein